jgi:hypothetical protein
MCTSSLGLGGIGRIDHIDRVDCIGPQWTALLLSLCFKVLLAWGSDLVQWSITVFDRASNQCSKIGIMA